MKVAIIGSRGYPYVYGGYETFVKEVGERFVKRGIDVRVYCHKSLFENRPKKVNGIELVYFRTIQKKNLSQLIHSFQAMIHACFSDVDVIIVVNSANGPFGLISKIFRKPTAINVDGLEWLRPKWKGLGSIYFYWASKLSTKLYDVIINDSFEMQKFYEQEFKTQSIMIAYGANIKYSDQPELIQRWNLEPGGYYLIVGRLIPDNNADIIIREFLNSNSKKKLVVVGDVPYKNEYADRIKAIKNDRLVLTGYVKDADVLSELYLNSYAYIHGHEFGGTNPTILKALAYGCAVISLDTVFSHEVLDGCNHGIYFKKDNSSLSQIIERTEQDPTNLLRYRSDARERIKSTYTWEKITDQYIELINKMATSKKSELGVFIGQKRSNVQLKSNNFSEHQIGTKLS